MVDSEQFVRYLGETMKNVDNYSFMDINRIMRGVKVYANVNGSKGEIEKFRNHFESLLSRFT
jgi:hypothetical protein